MNTVHAGKVHGANIGPTWVLSAPGGPHVGLMNLAIGDVFISSMSARDFRLRISIHTEVRKIIHQYDFFQQLGRGPVEDTVDQSKEWRPALVVEADYYARVRHLVHTVRLVVAPKQGNRVRDYVMIWNYFPQY